MKRQWPKPVRIRIYIPRGLDMVSMMVRKICLLAIANRLKGGIPRKNGYGMPL